MTNVRNTHRRETLVRWLATAALGVFLLLAISVPARSQDRRPTVETVYIVGNVRISDDDIYSRLVTRPGEEFVDSQVVRDFQTILEMHVFDTTQSRVIIEAGPQGGIVVTFEVCELPQLLGVTFKGLRYVEESEVLTALREKGISFTRGEFVDYARFRTGTRVIQEFLASRGWVKPVVTLRVKQEEAHAVSMEYNVEGPK